MRRGGHVLTVLPTIHAMGGWPAFALAAVAAELISGATSCTSTVAPVPVACTEDPAVIARALDGAPGTVRLVDGTSISTCVLRAQSEGDLQSVGAVLTTVADDLRVSARSQDPAALRLGYLIGAVRRGASHTNGVQAELVRRLEQDSLLDGTPITRQAAMGRGIAAGQAGG